VFLFFTTHLLYLLRRWVNLTQSFHFPYIANQQCFIVQAPNVLDSKATFPVLNYLKKEFVKLPLDLMFCCRRFRVRGGVQLRVGVQPQRGGQTTARLLQGGSSSHHHRLCLLPHHSGTNAIKLFFTQNNVVAP
jgi:hypothetical protein